MVYKTKNKIWRLFSRYKSVLVVDDLCSLITLSLDCSSVTVFLGRKKGFSSLRDFPGTNLYRVVKQFTKGLEQRRYKMDGGSCERTMHFVLEQRVKKPFLARI